MARVWASKHVPGEAGVPRFSRPLRESLPWDGHSYTPPEIYSIV
jgi:hypothetical protein